MYMIAWKFDPWLAKRCPRDLLQDPQHKLEKMRLTEPRGKMPTEWVFCCLKLCVGQQTSSYSLGQWYTAMTNKASFSQQVCGDVEIGLKKKKKESKESVKGELRSISTCRFIAQATPELPVPKTRTLLVHLLQGFLKGELAWADKLALGAEWIDS